MVEFFRLSGSESSSDQLGNIIPIPVGVLEYGGSGGVASLQSFIPWIETRRRFAASTLLSSPLLSTPSSIERQPPFRLVVRALL